MDEGSYEENTYKIPSDFGAQKKSEFTNCWIRINMKGAFPMKASILFE